MKAAVPPISTPRPRNAEAITLRIRRGIMLLPLQESWQVAGTALATHSSSERMSQPFLKILVNPLVTRLARPVFAILLDVVPGSVAIRIQDSCDLRPSLSQALLYLLSPRKGSASGREHQPWRPDPHPLFRVESITDSGATSL